MATVAGVPDEYKNLMGSQPAFVFTSQDVFPTPYTPTLSGSTLGAPPPNMPVGQSPNTSGGDAAAYAQSKQGQPAHSQPIFWHLVLLVVGVVLLSHVAKVNIRT